MQRFLPFFLCAPLYFSSKKDSKLNNTMSKLFFVHQSHFMHTTACEQASTKMKIVGYCENVLDNIVQKISYKVL